MKLKEFEAQGLWTRLTFVEGALSQLRAGDDGQNIDALDELDTRAGQLRAAFKARRRLASLIVQDQISGIDTIYSNVESAVGNAQASGDMSTRGQYLQQAIVYAQQATVQQGNWPHAYPSPAEERLEVAVVDALLERTRDVDDEVRSRLNALITDIDAADERLASVLNSITQAETNVRSLVQQATDAVTAEKTRIGSVIDDGKSTIAGFEKVLRARLEKWQTSLTDEFRGSTQTLRDDQTRLYQEAVGEYESLAHTINDYQALVQADSADRLARHYEDASRRASRSGWALTVSGLIVLLLAIVPLVLVLLQPLWQPGATEPSWQSLVARIGIGAILVGAATVAIRLGTGFQRTATDYKRLAMELRTMGPFLAAVADTESVDQARLDLVNRTFGQVYGTQRDEKLEEAVPVSVLQQLLVLLTKTISR